MQAITELSVHDAIILGIVAFLIGMSKTGIHGTGMLAVPLLALAFGGMASSAVMLPMLCIADVIGVVYYHRHASWKHLESLFPAAAVGIVVGSLVGAYIDDEAFKTIMGVVIVLSIVLLIWVERRKESIPHSFWFSRTVGATGGFTSMIGNLAGSVMAVYFLSARLPKNVFIGTTAWFFLVVNYFKVPFHVFHWKTITTDTLAVSLAAIPAISAGALAGIAIVKKISDTRYRWFIIGMTLLAALLMLT